MRTRGEENESKLFGGEEHGVHKRLEQRPQELDKAVSDDFADFNAPDLYYAFQNLGLEPGLLTNERRAPYMYDCFDGSAGTLSEEQDAPLIAENNQLLNGLGQEKKNKQALLNDMDKMFDELGESKAAFLLRLGQLTGKELPEQNTSPVQEDSNPKRPQKTRMRYDPTLYAKHHKKLEEEVAAAKAAAENDTEIPTMISHY